MSLDALNCRLGQWYNGEAKERYATTKSYSKIAQPHETIHKDIEQNIKYLEEQTVLKNREKIVENFREMEDASHQLFDALDTMLDEINR
jgi:DNA primase catalytic subunit